MRTELEAAALAAKNEALAEAAAAAAEREATLRSEMEAALQALRTEMHAAAEVRCSTIGRATCSGCAPSFGIPSKLQVAGLGDYHARNVLGDVATRDCCWCYDSCVTKFVSWGCALMRTQARQWSQDTCPGIPWSVLH